MDLSVSDLELEPKKSSSIDIHEIHFIVDHSSSTSTLSDPFERIDLIGEY